MERVYGFGEMMHYIDTDPDLQRKTAEMIEHTKVYDSFFMSQRMPLGEGKVTIEENLTLRAARKAVQRGRLTAVLNFANPVEPGGGVLRGAKAQEENLCRSSNLYKALISERTASYYETNRRENPGYDAGGMFLDADRVIYSENVTVLKDNEGYSYTDSGIERYISQPYTVDVITCAAPYFPDAYSVLPNEQLQRIFERRIRNILETAIEHEVETIVLGAFGCGAFHNPPETAALAFRNVLLEERYRHAFDEVIFAIKRTAWDCPNIKWFAQYFNRFPEIDESGLITARRGRMYQ